MIDRSEFDPDRADSPSRVGIAVSLLICSRNRPSLLAETVHSVLAGQELPDEIVLIDQSAEPHAELATLGAVRGCAVRYHWSPGIGVSRARNQAAAAAYHEVLAWLDDDMYVELDWFSALGRAFVAAGARATVCGRVLPAAPEAVGGFTPTVVSEEKPAVFQGRARRDVLTGGHMILARSALVEAGGFDERLGSGTRFPAAEDLDLGFRLLEAGHRIVYAPQAVVYHRAWRPANAYLRMRWNYGVGHGAYYAKHLNLHDRYVLQWLIRELRRGFVVEARRHWAARRPRLAAGDWVFSSGMVIGVCRWLLAYRRPW